MISNERRKEAPTSLAEQTSWRKNDVIRALWVDFKKKCYLTEQRVLEGGFEIDHRHPKEDGGPHYDWENLYPCTHKVNQRRLKKWPDGGLLQPDGRDDVETRLTQKLTFHCGELIRCDFSAVDPNDPAAVNAAHELNHIHNDEGSMAAADLRSLIQFRYTELVQAQLALSELDPQEDHAEWQSAVAELRRLAGPYAEFSGLLRGEVLNRYRELVAPQG